MPFERPGDVLRTIISGAQARLVAGGTLLVEHGVDRRDTILSLFESAHFTRLIAALDFGGPWRIARGGVEVATHPVQPQ